MPAWPITATIWPWPAHAACQGVLELSQLDLAANQGRLGRDGTGQRLEMLQGRARRGGRHSPGRGRSRRGSLENVTVERLRLGFGLGLQLVLERGDAELELAERRSAPTELRVEPHQGPVNRLLQRVQAHQPKRRLNGRLERARVALVGEQSRERLQGELAQAHALRDQPFLEWRFLQCEAFEEVARMESSGPFQCGRATVGHALLELVHVHADRGRIERHRLGLEPQRVRVAQRLPEGEQHLA